MIDLESIRERWIAERPTYEALGEHIAGLLREEIQHKGVFCRVEARAKDIASLLKKILRKSYAEPYDHIPDKVGVRIVVNFAGDVPAVEEVVRRRFEVRRHENKTLGLHYYQLGYLGVHFDVSLLGDHVIEERWRGLACEIQVHTRAQNCWADVSHRLLYKPAQEAPVEIKRRVFRLMALVELFDETVEDARRTIDMLPRGLEARLLTELEYHFYQLIARDYDRELSLDIIGALGTLYAPEELANFKDRLAGFVELNRAKLTEILSEYRSDERSNPLLFQPESLLVFERLEREPFRLKETWVTVFPLSLLENLAAVWGRPI